MVIVINSKYVPKTITKKDKLKQLKMIQKSQKLYKKKIYFIRKKIKSFTSKQSKHIIKAKEMYDIKSIKADKEFSKKTGCSIKSLKKIINKGEGAYYSSGSRPNQTAQSWGVARLASALTGGKAGAIDYKILESGCNKESIGYKMAQKSKQKYGKGLSKASKIKIDK